MRTAIYPGSFDPVTNGHLNIITRAARSFDRLVVCVMYNCEKSPMFTPEERVELIRRVTADIPNVAVMHSNKLLADFGGRPLLCRAREVPLLSRACGPFLISSVNSRWRS